MLISCVIISPSVSTFDHTNIIVRTLSPAQPFLGSPAAMPYAAEAEAAYNYLRLCVKEEWKVPRGVGGLVEKHVRLVARSRLRRCTEHEVAAAAAQQRPSWCSRVAVLEEARLPAEACPLPRQGRALHKEGEVRLRMKKLWLTANDCHRFTAASFERGGSPLYWEKCFQFLPQHCDPEGPYFSLMQDFISIIIIII